MAWVPAMIGGLASVVGGERRNRMETKLSNTAHQREALDLEAAGLNRILTATGGAGAPVPSLGNVGEGAQAAVSSAFSSMRARQERELLQRQIQLTGSQERKTRLEADQVGYQNEVNSEFLRGSAASALEAMHIDNDIRRREVPRAQIETDLWQKGKNLYDSVEEAIRKMRGGPSMRTGGKF